MKKTKKMGLTLALAIVLIAVAVGGAVWPRMGTTLSCAVKDAAVTTLRRGALRGKKIACLGDSITAGTGGHYNADGSLKGYCYYLAQYSGAEVVNLGISGAPLGGPPNPNNGGTEQDIIVNRYQEIPQDSDIIILLAGINDFYIGVDTFGSMEERAPGSYCGDAALLFDGLAEHYPDAEIWIVTPYDNWNLHVGMVEERNFPFENFVNVQLALAQEDGYPVIDLFHEEFMDNKWPLVDRLAFSDSLHPNDLGYRLLALHIMARLVSDP